jgi:hypothetical protein
MGTVDEQRRTCRACGHRVDKIAIAGSPSVVLEACDGCLWRRWSLGGKEATVEEVLAVIHGRPFRRSISPLTVRMRTSRPRPVDEPEGRAKILPLRRPRPAPSE